MAGPADSVPTIFDAHVHIYSADRQKYPQVAGRERPIEPSGSAEALLAELDRHGVAAALLVQSRWLSEDNRYLVEAMHTYPGRFAALGVVEDPLAADAPARLRRQYEEDGFRGVRLHLFPDVDEGVRAGAADPLIQEARRLGVPVQFLNRIPTHPTILGVARRFPDLPVVVDHLGHPEKAEAPDYASSAVFFSLAAQPNVYVKMSSHQLHSAQEFPWADLDDFQRRTIDAFGPRRLMWGSNWPVPTAINPPYTQRLDTIRHHLPAFQELTADEQAWILGRTALSLWQPVGTAQ
jgi:L-fuconolactonase